MKWSGYGRPPLPALHPAAIRERWQQLQREALHKPQGRWGLWGSRRLVQTTLSLRHPTAHSLLVALLPFFHLGTSQPITTSRAPSFPERLPTALLLKVQSPPFCSWVAGRPAEGEKSPWEEKWKTRQRERRRQSLSEALSVKPKANAWRGEAVY